MIKKKGKVSNCQFDPRPLKVRNRPDFLACRWRATYHWKDLDEGYNFALDFITIKAMHATLCIPKWESQDKMPFGCGPRGKL